MDKKKGWLLTLIIITIILLYIISSNMLNSSIMSKIDKDPSFVYATSLTNQLNYSDRADIYTSQMNVVDTAKHIMNLKRPYSHTNLRDDLNIQLTYDDHYILIYKNEDSKTYIQVSTRKFIHKNGYYTLYRPYSSHIIMFYDDEYQKNNYSTDTNRYGSGYVTNNKIKQGSQSNSKITVQSKSVRQGSTSSRSSMGGGTSFGK